LPLIRASPAVLLFHRDSWFIYSFALSLSSDESSGYSDAAQGFALWALTVRPFLCVFPISESGKKGESVLMNKQLFLKRLASALLIASLVLSGCSGGASSTIEITEPAGCSQPCLGVHVIVSPPTACLDPAMVWSDNKGVSIQALEDIHFFPGVGKYELEVRCKGDSPNTSEAGWGQYNVYFFNIADPTPPETVEPTATATFISIPTFTPQAP
jgi:hypothetical protein